MQKFITNYLKATQPAKTLLSSFKSQSQAISTNSRMSHFATEIDYNHACKVSGLSHFDIAVATSELLELDLIKFSVNGSESVFVSQVALVKHLRDSMKDELASVQKEIDIMDKLLESSFIEFESQQ